VRPAPIATIPEERLREHFSPDELSGHRPGQPVTGRPHDSGYDIVAYSAVSSDRRRTRNPVYRVYATRGEY
jgi:hypothetical protein